MGRRGVKEHKKQKSGLLCDDKGIGIVEIILILVVLIGLVLIFKDQIEAIIMSAFESISGDSQTIIGK